MTKSKKRDSHGNMIALMTAITAGITIALLFFALNLTRLMGGHQEQMTAIESAALAASKAVCRIVIEDPHFGFIALSDYPPTGKGTTAGDNYYLPVHSINTILATVRLDMIIADRFNDPLMRQCADRDYNYAMTARASLVSALQSSIAPNGTGTDMDGITVEPLKEAINAYQANSVRMTGQTRLVPGTMTITLGCMEDSSTNTVIPNPQNFAQMAPADQERGLYKACRNVAYNNKAFVFASMGPTFSLVDPTKFRQTIVSLPYQIPSLVKCDADQEFIQVDHAGKQSVYRVHATACANPGSRDDIRPAPGAFLVTFRQGTMPELTNLYDIFTYETIQQSPCDRVDSPLSGDFSATAMTLINLPVVNKAHPRMGQAMTLALYDWIRRCGTRLNIASLEAAMLKPFTADNTSHSVQYHVNKQGLVSTDSVGATATVFPTSHKQWRAISGLAMTSQQKYYDVILKDYVHQPGRIRGGNHAGEPYIRSNNKITGGVTPQFLDEDPNDVYEWPVGPGGGAVRPSDQTDGIAVEIRFRPR